MAISATRLVPGGALSGPIFERLSQPAPAPVPDLPFGPFRAVRELGRGGMAVVYLGERVEGGFEQHVALKLIDVPGDAAPRLSLFRQERQLLARLQHPHIAALVDGGQLADGRPWFALERVEGERIDTWCRRRSLSVTARLALFRQVCDAIAFAHGRLTVHRDLKPSNILVTDDGRVKLLDFGIAALLDHAGVAVAATHALTPGFASPEQVRGEAATTAGDIWQLGRLLALLMGIAARADEDTPDPVARRSTRDADLRAIVDRATADDPAARYGTVAALVDDLDRWKHGWPVRARHGGALYHLGCFLRRRRWVVAPAAAVLALAVGGTVAYTLGIARERDAAAREAQRANAVLAFLNDELLAAANPYAHGADARVLDVLARARERLDAGAFAGNPAIERALRLTIGTGLAATDQYDAARTELLRAQALAGTADTDRGEQIAIRQALAETAQLASDFGEARRRFDALIAELSAQPDADPDHLAHLRLSRLTALTQDGAGEAALAEYPPLIAELEARGATATALYAGVLSGHGDALRATGDLDAAIGQLQRAVATLERVAGDDGFATWSARNNLAHALRIAGRLDEAIVLQERVVAQQRGRFGDDHQNVLTARNELAGMYQDARRWPEAEAIFRDVLVRRERLLGDRHLGTRNSLNNLGLVLSLQGRLDEAEPLYRRALALEVELRGPDHLDVLVLQHNLAGLERRRGRFAAAHSLHRAVIDAAARTLEATRPEHGLFRTGLGRTLEAAGRSDEAAEAYAQAREQLLAAYGADHPRVRQVEAMRAALDPSSTATGAQR